MKQSLVTTVNSNPTSICLTVCSLLYFLSKIIERLGFDQISVFLELEGGLWTIFSRGVEQNIDSMVQHMVWTEDN